MRKAEILSSDFFNAFYKVVFQSLLKVWLSFMRVINFRKLVFLVVTLFPIFPSLLYAEYSRFYNEPLFQCWAGSGSYSTIVYSNSLPGVNGAAEIHLKSYFEETFAVNSVSVECTGYCRCSATGVAQDGTPWGASPHNYVNNHRCGPDKVEKTGLSLYQFDADDGLSGIGDYMCREDDGYNSVCPTGEVVSTYEDCPVRKSENCPSLVANPVNFRDGVKEEFHADYRGNGPFPLVVGRYYSGTGSAISRGYWRFRFSPTDVRHLEFPNRQSWQGFDDVVWVRSADGSIEEFVSSDGVLYQSEGDVVSTLEHVDRDWPLEDEWILTDKNDQVRRVQQRGANKENNNLWWALSFI